MTGDTIRAGAYSMPILYLDNHLLAVIKPNNLPVQRDRSGDVDALSACKAYIGERFQKPGDVYLGLVHRLDRPVGGALLFARTSKAAARLSKQFADHTADKRYAAVVRGALLGAGELQDYLLKDEASGNVCVAPEGTLGAKLARLSWEAIKARDNMTLLDIRLMTGRAHQIRVQLKNAGHPILYDARYGEVVRGMPIALWSYYLALDHPTKPERIALLAPPHQAPFDEFSRELEDLYVRTQG